MLLTIIVFVITLLVLVVIHELGHFLMAKRFDIKVLEFGFGIPPKAWGKKIGETIVSINWLPFGGFVRLLGEDEVNKKILKDKRSFAAASVDKRIIVVVAGVVMNLLLAWLLFYITLGSQGFKTQLPLLIDHQFVGVKQNDESMVLVASVADNSPASQAGIKPEERVISLNDQPISSYEELVSKTKELAGNEVKLTLSDLSKLKFRDVTLTPRQDPPEGQGPMGVGLATVKLANLEYADPLQKFLVGPIHAWNLIAYSGKIIGNLVGKSFEQKSFDPVSTSVSGPVGITSIANTILTSSDNPVLPYLDFVAVLSLNLAVLNLLPFPALDGGRLFFLLIEAVTRRRVHPEFERWVHTVGMAILLTLIILITFSDIRKIFL